ncbi:MAG: zinc-binding dehydrogenase [Pseudomonadota bacterium]|uniref:zinc-binding dehydrogenase n=1 Tax=Phenylobacterium sp. TaxID=1871053 RepID=UPI0025DA917A|nr:zinc-binding dehydrogenase [Phenylobacterium sp.]MBT9470213.1 zinc-binding dehydrogenase [Phenylobacterium sp.]
MKAYQVVEFGAPILANEVADPSPSASQVVVKVASCGLCHSDLHFHEGHLSLGGGQKLPLPAIGAPTPLTMGHEIFGHIAAYGPDAGLSQTDIGRSVIVYPWIGCGGCQACLDGRDNECAKPENLGLHRSGGHAEKVVVRDPKFLIDASGIDPDMAGVYACSGLTAYSALAKLPRKSGWVAIVGVGGVGLMALALAKAMGFEKVVAVDVDDAKLRLATESYGADLAINSRSEDAIEVLKAKTGGVSGVIDFVGADATVQLALGSLINAGVYVAVGLFGGTLQVPVAALASRQLTLRGSFVGTPAELRDLIDLVRKGDVKPIPFRRAPISEINADMAALSAGKIQGRVVHFHANGTPAA